MDLNLNDKLLKNHDLIEKFLTLVKKTKPDYFLEVGAFEASASIYISTHLSNTQCIAYEANPFNYNYFKKQFLRYNNLEYTNLAISNYDGKVSFFIQDKRNKKKFKPVKKNNSLLKRNDDAFQYKEITVYCNKIDTLYNANNLFCLWIDAEGKGYEVLEGAKNILANTKYILIEVEEKKHWKDQKLDRDVIKFLNKLGFKILLRDQEYESQYNILFEKK